jgi:cell wall-associated NlpC family hydrolase
MLATTVAAAAIGTASTIITTTGPACAPLGAAGPGAAGYGPDQITNAATIIAVGKQLNIPEHGWVVAIAATLQESGLHNLDYGDRDSLGLFQQRPSQGWGTPTQIMNPTYATTQFYRHLLAIPGWQQMSVNDAAQAVERSAYPDAYAQHEAAARQLAHTLAAATCTTPTTVDCTHPPAPTSPALTAVSYACAQLGKPYTWGGNGNPGFDCSGLTHAAYAAAGITIPRTAQTQYNTGPLLLPATPLRPGDLVFFGTPHHIYHVGISLGGTKIIHAPDTNQTVQIDDYQNFPDYAGARRPTVR